MKTDMYLYYDYEKYLWKAHLDREIYEGEDLEEVMQYCTWYLKDEAEQLRGETSK